MKEEMIAELKKVQALLIADAIDYIQYADEEEDDNKAAEYYHIYEGYIKAVAKVQERIEEIRREGL